jgi:large subunit ribosomal protein L23
MALFGKQSDTTKDTATPSTKFDAGAAAMVLLRPRVTEKATLANDKFTYVFEVPQDATKIQIKQAVKLIYNVNPAKVTTVRMRPQAYEARMRRRSGQHKGFKKAYVHLKKGETLDIMK